MSADVRELAGDLRRCEERGRHIRASSHNTDSCPHRMDDESRQAEFDRYDEAMELVLRSTRSVSAALVPPPTDMPDEEPRIEISLAEYERLAGYIGQYGRLRALLHELVR